MFYIDDFNRDENVTIEDAVSLINGYNKDQGLLENMKFMKARLEALMNCEDFCDDWCYEINAYNKVFIEMNKLFGDK